MIKDSSIYDENFGDIVLYRSKSIEGWTFSRYTGSNLIHCALRISKGEAESTDLRAWLITGDLMKHDLNNPRKYYTGYLIFRHKDIDSKKRGKMMEQHEILSKKYDWSRIPKIGRRHRKGITQDLEDISTNVGERLCCLDRICWTNYFSGLHMGLDDIHFSQLEPHQLLDSENFDIIEQGFRRNNGLFSKGEWVREEVHVEPPFDLEKISESHSEPILQNYFTSS